MLENMFCALRSHYNPDSYSEPPVHQTLGLPLSESESNRVYIERVVFRRGLFPRNLIGFEQIHSSWQS